MALLLLALTACERGYPESAKSTDTTAFLGAMFVGQAVAFVVEQGSVPRRVAIRLLWLALLLPWTTASILPGLIETDFAYRGARRWTGLWTNPNTFGALMGTGFVLSTGWLLVGSWHAPWRRFAKPTASSLEIIVWIPLAASVLSLGHGLVRSYSRGAWLGKVLGLGFLAWHLRKHSRRTEPRAQLWHRPNGLATVVTLIGVGVSVFWLARDTEWPLLRRVLSVANPNDFSWRNRVATLSDSLRIVADAPWTGVGWNRPLYHHAQWYQELELFENGAITLNDYLMLPMTLGLPALFAFAWSVRNSFRGRVGKELCCDLGGHEKSYETERITSMAAILTLMVVFWFDGGLFRLALAVPFWTRVACGQTGSSLYSNR